jgi:hypothetical protein
MKLDTIIRSFLIAGLISLLAVLLESAYYGLHPEKTSSIGNAAYSITSPFISTGINGPINIAIIAIIFISTFLVMLNKLSKKERA